MSIAASADPFARRLPPVVGIWDDVERDNYRFYDVEIQCTDLLLGASPKQPDALFAWLKSQFPKQDDLREKLLEHVRLQGIDVTQDATVEQMWDQLKDLGQEQYGRGFYQDENGLFFPSRCIKAMMREATSVRFAGEYWKPGKNSKGEDSGRAKLPQSHFVERVSVVEDKTYVMRRQEDGSLSHVAEPDGTFLHIGHPKDQFGNTRPNLSYFDYCVQPVMGFVLRVEHRIPTDDQLRDALITGQRHGLWGAHSMGFGQFRVTRFERA